MAIRSCRSLFLCFLLSSAVLLAQPAPPKDIDGWSKAKWGMSEKAVQTVFAPDVKKLPQPAKYDDRYFDLELTGFKSGQLSFTVRFLMDGKSDRLTGVSLQSEDSKLSAELFLTLEKDLIQKYGPPNHRSKGTRLLTGWNFPTTTIEMLYAESPLAGRFIYLNYNSTAKTPSARP